MANHRLSGEHVLREAFDGQTKTLRAKLEETEMSFNLSAKEDSITSHKAVKMTTIEAEASMDILGCSKISIYGEPSTSVKVSPVVDADIWYLVAEIPQSGVLTLDIVAARIKSNKQVQVVGI